MDFTNFSKVEEHISDSTANRYIAVGWKLLFVGQLDDGEYRNVAYVVGWPKELGNPIEPELTYPKLGEN